MVSFFQQLHSKLEERQAALLEQLSQMYHTLMTPLQEAIRQLRQTANYTGYVGVLSRYSQVAGVCDSIGDTLIGISMFVANYIAPTDPYSVRVDYQNEQTITNSMNGFLKLTKGAVAVPNPIQGSFQPKRHISYQLGMEVMNLVRPSDIAFDPTTNTYYALFDTYWKTYLKFNNILKDKQTTNVTNKFTFPNNSSIALLNNSVIIMANHILYVYSEKGEVINQFLIQNQIGLFFNNPKIYTFNGISSIYLASIESPHVYKVSYQNGTKEGGINLTNGANQRGINLKSQAQAYNYPGDANFADMVRSPAQVNQLLILYTPQHSSTNNQYWIQSVDINTMQITGMYSLSQQMSPFCCLTAMNDTLCVLDVGTGSLYKYLFSGTAANNPTNYYPNYYNQVYSWTQHSIATDCIPKCTKLEAKMERAFYDQKKKQIILFFNGKICFIT